MLSAFLTQGVGSSGKGLGLGSFPIKSKVQILLTANNSLDQPTSEAGVLPDACEGNALHGSEVYSTSVGTRSGPALEEFLVIKKNIYMF